ncbi:MAG TPA: hypothetical protein VF198_12945 [Vicinamibacterales bacterium]
MLDDLLEGLLGEAIVRRFPAGRRAELYWRVFFGLLGTGLGLIGAIYTAANFATANVPMRLSAVALMLALAAFSLFNVALLRPWRWPGLWFVASFVALLVTRIAFGR